MSENSTPGSATAAASQPADSAAAQAAVQLLLETPRLLLRPVVLADTGLIRLYTQDAAVARMTGRIPHPLPPGATEAYVKRVVAGETPDETIWAITHKGSGADGLIGLISLRGAENELGYWLGAPFWSTGFATEAVEAVIGYAVSAGYSRLTASVFQDNPASARVLTKAGFHYTGEGPQSYSAARGAPVETWTYTLEAAQWQRAG